MKRETSGTQTETKSEAKGKPVETNVKSLFTWFPNGNQSEASKGNPNVWVPTGFPFQRGTQTETKVKPKGNRLETNVKRETSGTQTETKSEAKGKPFGNQREKFPFSRGFQRETL